MKGGPTDPPNIINHANLVGRIDASMKGGPTDPPNYEDSMEVAWNVAASMKGGPTDPPNDYRGGDSYVLHIRFNEGGAY